MIAPAADTPGLPTGDILERLAAPGTGEGVRAEPTIGEVGLALSDAAAPGREAGGALAVLREMERALCEAGAAHGAARRGALLREVIVDRWGFRGDAKTLEDPNTCDLIETIHRRMGTTVGLGVIYLHVSQAMGWRAGGLAFPGQFLLRLDDEGGGRLIVDPFHDGATLEACDLRALLKASQGVKAELSPAHYKTVSNRAVLRRLQDEGKTRALERGDYPGALAALERMLLLEGQDHRLWREAGLMNMRVGDLEAAVRSLETYLTLAPPGKDRDRIEKVMRELRQRIL